MLSIASVLLRRQVSAASLLVHAEQAPLASDRPGQRRGAAGLCRRGMHTRPHAHAWPAVLLLLLLLLLGSLRLLGPLLLLLLLLLLLTAGWERGSDAARASQRSSAVSTAAVARARASTCQRCRSSAGPGCTTSNTVAARDSSTLHRGGGHGSQRHAGDGKVAEHWAWRCEYSGQLYDLLTRGAPCPSAWRSQEHRQVGTPPTTHLTALPTSRSSPSSVMDEQKRRGMRKGVLRLGFFYGGRLLSLGRSVSCN